MSRTRYHEYGELSGSFIWSRETPVDPGSATMTWARHSDGTLHQGEARTRYRSESSHLRIDYESSSLSECLFGAVVIPSWPWDQSVRISSEPAAVHAANDVHDVLEDGSVAACAVKQSPWYSHADLVNAPSHECPQPAQGISVPRPNARHTNRRKLTSGWLPRSPDIGISSRPACFNHADASITPDEIARVGRA